MTEHPSRRRSSGGYEPTGDEELNRGCRNELRRRLTDIAQQHKTKAGQLAALSLTAPEPRDDLAVLEELTPTTLTDLNAVPEALRRDLYDSFNLELHFHSADRAVTIRVTVRQDRLSDIRAAIDRTSTEPTHTGTIGHHATGGPISADRSLFWVPGAGVEPARPRRAREV